ncbi:hypothetical protein C8C85_3339 [Flavobacterium sp. 103]|uniref:hypothetical protein n=1 Tax=unclassified Flavobacterium TaxID=196869 RepID=UPI000D5CFC64|nr:MULTISPECIES: hypothetical protein [unclassified Flavobacterium]PVX47398.1 hypothetical protein C8C85_3339 [Flavobacterium sp. 103]QKJ63990.1 hypothetical protein HQN62_12925 [Flavobacterium sp. M31R6]
MRVIINFICLCIFLLGGGQHLHADTHPIAICDSPSWDFVKKQQVKLRTAEPGSVLIEDADVDLDEEFHRSDDLKNGGANKILAAKHSLLDSWYLTFSNEFIFKDYSKQFENFASNCAHSNPIYLRIGVLRI